jgi:4-hydroxybenzoate polyprenyltransferase
MQAEMTVMSTRVADVKIVETSRVPSARVLGRVDNWWYSKVAPALALSFCSALIYQVSAIETAQSILIIAFVGLCAGSYGHIINDVFDIEVDRNAGKRNHMAHFAPWQRFGLCALTLALGFAPALLVSWSPTSLALLAVEFLLPTIYSVPPLRLKGRGALGLVCDSLGAHLVPCLYVISVLAHQSSQPALVHARASLAFVWTTAVWALFLGLKGILIHEFEDRENDLRSGIKTFATGVEFRSVRWPNTLFYVVELCAFLGLVTVLFPVAPIIGIAFGTFAITRAIKLSVNWEHYRHYEIEATTIQWWQLSHGFYEAYLPTAAALGCAWIHPSLALFPLLLIVVFASNFRQEAEELKGVLRPTLAWIGWRGRLDLDAVDAAWAWPILLPRPGVRVVVHDPGEHPWNIRIARPGLALRAGEEYVIRFQVRCDRKRKLAFGVWQDHAPWQGLGYYEDLWVSTERQYIERRFTATADDKRAYFGFWLGGDTGSVQILRCRLRALGRRIGQEQP